MDYERLVRLTVSYFKYKNYNDFESYSNLKYNWWRRVIGFVCGLSDRVVIRSLFDRLVKRGVLKQIKKGKSTYYVFDVYNEYGRFAPRSPPLYLSFA